MKMKALLACVVIAAGAANTWAVTIMGQPSCGKWVADKSSQWASARHGAWLTGYLSGMSVAYDVDVLQRPDYDSLVLWMDNYCKANPLVPVSTGGTVLFEELKAQMERQR